MKLPRFVSAAAICTLAVTIVGCSTAAPPPPPSAPAAPAVTPVERGRHLVSVSGCHDCHTPWKPGPNGIPEPDMSRALTGHPESEKLPPPPKAAGPWVWGGSATSTAFWGPWGISYAMNLTPDENTGIGIWTEDMFMRAIREGKHMGTSRPILPPMPWHVYRNYSDDDLKAIFAYLKSLPPTKNRIPDAVINEPPPAGK